MFDNGLIGGLFRKHFILFVKFGFNFARLFSLFKLFGGKSFLLVKFCKFFFITFKRKPVVFNFFFAYAAKRLAFTRKFLVFKLTSVILFFDFPREFVAVFCNVEKFAYNRKPFAFCHFHKSRKLTLRQGYAL